MFIFVIIGSYSLFVFGKEEINMSNGVLTGFIIGIIFTGILYIESMIINNFMKRRLVA